MTPLSTAADRVRRRIDDWTKARGHGSKKDLAEAVPAPFGQTKSSTWVADVIADRQDLRLQDLDAVAEHMGVAPGDLVRRDTDHYLEVTPTEVRLLRYFRAMPIVIQQHLVAWMDYIYSFQEAALKEQSAERDLRTALARERHRTRPRGRKQHT